MIDASAWSRLLDERLSTGWHKCQKCLFETKEAKSVFLESRTHVILVTRPDTTQAMAYKTFPDSSGIDVVLA